MSTESLLNPVKATERIILLDVLRGIALIGIVFMNIEWFNRSVAQLASFDESLTGLDHATGWLIRCFIEGKFYKLFALLFGMGFGIMLLRARDKEQPFAGIYTRRMLILFIFGMLHLIFLWGGDILHDYAVTGMLLLGLVYLFRWRFFVRFDNPKSILIISLVWMVLPIVIVGLVGIGFGTSFNHDRWQSEADKSLSVYTQIEILKNEYDPLADVDTEEEENKDSERDLDKDSKKELSPEEIKAKKIKDGFSAYKKRTSRINKEIKALKDGNSYLEATKFRLKGSLHTLMITPGFSLLLLLPIFLFGYWLILSGAIKSHRQHVSLFNTMAWAGMGLGLAFTVSGLLVMQFPPSKSYPLLKAVGNITFGFGQYVMAAGYLGLFVRLFQSQRWNQYMSKLAPLGRMALTNYIMQSVILVTLFHGYAGGLYGKVSRAPQVLVVLAIIIFQVYFSKWWLSKFQFGPLEWLWRCLTYKKRYPLRKIIA